MLNNSGKEIEYVYTTIKLRERKKKKFVRKIQFDFTIHDKRKKRRRVITKNRGRGKR